MAELIIFAIPILLCVGGVLAMAAYLEEAEAIDRQRREHRASFRA